MKKIITILFILLNGIASSQVNQSWIVKYNGPSNAEDYGTAMVTDVTGNILLTGESEGNGTGFDYATIKYSTSGIQLWAARYNGTGNSSDYALAIASDNNGNVYITGESRGIGTGYDIVTIKYNSSGVQQWVSIYNDLYGRDDIGEAVAVDNTGNIYVTGCSGSSQTGQDYVTIKYNSSGQQQWVQLYHGNGAGYDYSFALCLDGSGNVIVTGYSYGIGTGSDFETIKYDPAGNLIWAKRYDGSGSGNPYDGARRISVDVLGNVYASGESQGNGTGGDFATVKYNSAGVQQWVARYNGPANGFDGAGPNLIDGAGNVYVTGYSLGNGTGYDYATVKYNSAGVQQWVQRFNRSVDSSDKSFSNCLDASGNIYVSGNSYGNGTQYDIMTIKYNSSGVQQWTQLYSGQANQDDNESSIAVDNSGNVYVAGYTYEINSNYDFVLIKYEQQTEVKHISSEIPEQYVLFQNYPNPFNPTTKIKFSLPFPSEGGVKLTVYDVMGRKVADLIPPLWGGQEGLAPGTYEVEWDASNYPSGVYFYKFETKTFSQTKKLVLLK